MPFESYLPRPPTFMKSGIQIDWNNLDLTKPMAIPVSSKAIEHIYHNPITEDTEVYFRDGRVYRYFDIPTNLVLDWIQSSSVGRFFNFQIRDNFIFEEIT